VDIKEKKIFGKSASGWNYFLTWFTKHTIICFGGTSTIIQLLFHQKLFFKHQLFIVFFISLTPSLLRYRFQNPKQALKNGMSLIRCMVRFFSKLFRQLTQSKYCIKGSMLEGIGSWEAVL
tara:strand:+ start:1636 stop:1995 length:360 start_codon:yes stop_codon:yes gene_type:complete